MEVGFSRKPQGSGQGNGVAPQLWAVVSTKMFDILHSLNLENVITCPITGTDMNLVGFAYVDDSDLFAWDASNAEATVQKMQKIVDNWEMAAKVTGGALAPEKCWWYLVRFQWDVDGNWKYVKENNSFHLTTKDANNNTETIKYLQPQTAQEMLGVHIAPDGNNKAQVQSLKQRARYFADAIRTSNIYATEAWIALTTIAMKSIEYCLPSTTLTETECKEIMWILIESFAPKAGINRYIKRDVLYALPQGLGLRNIYYTQGISHVVELIEHVWKSSVTGHFLMVSLESLRLELGINEPILNSNFSYFNDKYQLTPSWISNTWEFLSLHSITVDVDAHKIPKKRKNDSPLMAALLQHGIDRYTLNVVNKCRQYLKIFMISDMTTGCGKKITSEAWNCQRNDFNSTDSLLWPNTPPPSSKMVKVWQNTIHLVLCRERKMHLDTQLGKWIGLPKTWRWFVDEDSRLWQRVGEKYYQHVRTQESHRRSLYSTQASSTPDLVTNVTTKYPTVITKIADELAPTGYVAVVDATGTDPGSVQTYHQWLQFDIEMHQDLASLRQALTAGQAKAVCDGSFHSSTNLGAAAWVITDANFQPIIRG